MSSYELWLHLLHYAHTQKQEYTHLDKVLSCELPLTTTLICDGEATSSSFPGPGEIPWELA